MADGRKIDADSAPEQLHELRKDAKKLRYLLECFAAMIPAKRRKPYVRELRALQDNLGRHQDHDVQANNLRAIAAELHAAPAGIDPATANAIEVLAARFDTRRSAARNEFTERFAEYDRAATRRAFRTITDGLRR